MDNLTSRCKYEVVLFFALLFYNVSMAYASATQKEKKEVPSDHYLWLTSMAGKMLRGEIPFSEDMPERKD